MKIFPQYFWRSTFFNLSFYVATGVWCILFLPVLLMPRKWYMWVVWVFVGTVDLLEKKILGLHYEVRGLENLPKEGPYIVAAKHQSPYETFKLQHLFGDPAIILKKELLRIPLWGWYLWKSDVIAINRSTPDSALKSMEDGAKRVMAQGRPIVIFPQGTRVWPHETPKDKPYKHGVHRVQKATGLPVVPMALNTGYFWPRTSWVKKPGTVVFEFLKPIKPGLSKEEFLRKLEKVVEEKTGDLMEESKKMEEAGTFDEKKNRSPLVAAFFIALAFALYSGWWFYAAKEARAAYMDFLGDLTSEARGFTEPDISGYPGPVKLSVKEEYLQSPEGTLWVRGLEISGWPFPFVPIGLKASSIQADSFKWPQPLHFQNLSASVNVSGDLLTIHDSALHQNGFTGGVTGTVDFSQEPFPALNLNVSLQNHNDLLISLAQNGIIEERAALFISAGLTALQDEDGVVRVPLTQRNRTLYAGPLPVVTLPDRPPAPDNPPARSQ